MKFSTNNRPSRVFERLKFLLHMSLRMSSDKMADQCSFELVLYCKPFPKEVHNFPLDNSANAYCYSVNFNIFTCFSGYRQGLDW
jgi:hypothetical protein